MGQKAEVVTSSPRVAHITTVDLTHRFLLLGQLKRLGEEGFDVTAISAKGPWVSEIESEGIRHIPWPAATRSWAPLSDLRALFSLLRIFRREQFDVVHTHNPKPGFLGRIAARLSGVGVVVNTVHGLYAMPEDRLLKRRLVLGMERLAARFSDLELYQSEEDLRWARSERVVSSEKSRLLGNGCDIEYFHPKAPSDRRRVELREGLGIPAEAIVVGMVGRLVAEKGYREFIASAEATPQAGPEVRFLAIGEIDPAKPDSLPENEINRARRNVIFTGWRSDVRDLMSVMDIFVLPSWREGVPRSVIEAAAMGLPLVVTDIRGCREVVRDGVEGLLVAPRSENDLTLAIQKLIGDSELRRRMGEAARARVEERFDEAAVAGRVIESYRDLLSKFGFSSGEVRLRRGRLSDAHTLARLHREGLPDAFLPQLGAGFLRRLYRELVDEGVVIVAEDERGVGGFVAGVSSTGEFYRRFLKRKGVRAAIAAGPRLLRPRVLKGVAETAFYPRRNGHFPQAELLSIAVAPRLQRTGVGRALAEDFLAALGETVGEVKVVVGESNKAANRFYESLGFREAGTLEVHRGDKSKVWVRSCRSSSLSA